MERRCTIFKKANEVADEIWDLAFAQIRMRIPEHPINSIALESLPPLPNPLTDGIHRGRECTGYKYRKEVRQCHELPEQRKQDKNHEDNHEDNHDNHDDNHDNH